jgi:hypothetical protein
VFSERLKSDPRLAERIKLFMQAWGQDDQPAAEKDA